MPNIDILFQPKENLYFEKYNTIKLKMKKIKAYFQQNPRPLKGLSLCAVPFRESKGQGGHKKY
jgi:hypothetical protein